MSVKNPVSLIKSLYLLALAAAIFSTELVNAAVTPGAGKSVTLGWNPVPEPNLQGYRVFLGTQSGQYTQTFDTGPATSIPLDDLQAGQTYYFTVIAIGATGLESQPAAELQLTIATPPLPLGTSVAASGTGNLNLQWTFPSSAMGSSPDFIVQASADLRNWTEVATVPASDSIGGNGQVTQFSWSIPRTGDRMFYRLTAKNWLGTSSAP